MHLPCATQTATEGGGQIAEIARTFGVDWPHLIAQTISFGIVCAVLYSARLHADPADARGAAPADRRRPGQRREDRGGARADRGGAPRHAAPGPTTEARRLIEEARAAAARVRGGGDPEGDGRGGARPGARARGGRARSRVAARRGATPGRTAGRADDRSRHGQDPDRRGSAAAGVGDRQPARGMTRGPRVCERTSGPDGRRGTSTGSAS